MDILKIYMFTEQYFYSKAIAAIHQIVYTEVKWVDANDEFSFIKEGISELMLFQEQLLLNLNRGL